MTRVDDAFAAQPRTRFLPPGARRSAGLDMPLSIGHGQTNSQPSTVREMLRLLDVRPGMSVLDVGAGSGWTTALLGELTGPEGTVLGTEIVPALVELGAAHLSGAGVPWARIVEADPGVLGAPDEAPFDRVLVSAMARTLPLDLVAQLAPGGVMVAPVHGTMLRVVRRMPPRDDPAEARVTEHGGYRFVPLITP
ncbi:protein-L-isoaspartate O-methyltransferase family protein [Demequina mangrovi]|uniref:Protein-L-isoaspartate O-methyltransferase n=1 Tax=Demequina mangrovi TaxID=1043493 RepID=A0A1H7AIP0_9MICO|nr:protein-L-isoaspartate O-methyltransferase [Demequina mangrovi]SEJ65511.1 protein-L-isoaspartate(D-aspartate) O-methyltransferase [Demequina mangrovi]